MLVKYYYILMHQKDMLQNQAFEEILRERNNYYLSKNKIPDFWITISPLFIYDKSILENLKKTSFYKKSSAFCSSKKEQAFEIFENDNYFYSALVSVDPEFIKWIKLRFGYFEEIGKSINYNEESYKFIFDGVSGFIEINNAQNENNFFPLRTNKHLLSPNIINQKVLIQKHMMYLKSLQLIMKIS